MMALALRCTTDPYLPLFGSNYQDVFAFLVLITVLIFRPSGLLGERVASYFSAPPTAMPQVEAGKLVPLATTGPTRPAYLPNIPTVAEAGYPGFEALNWYAFVAPAKTPAPIVAKLNGEIVAVLKDPELRARFAAQGAEAVGSTSAEFGTHIRREIDKWGKVVRVAGLTVN